MGRLRSLIALPAVLALLGLGTGCAGGGFWKNKSTRLPPEVTGTAGRADTSAVIPAGGVSPFASLPSSLSWLAGKSDRPSKGGVAAIVATWQNHIDYLPDPTRNGAMGSGLAGQIFVFDPSDLPALLSGSVTVELQDETKRPPGVPPLKPERWTFTKDVIASLRSVDERFGPNYTIFLPWPTYRPDVTHVRISVVYQPENGSFPIRALESRLTLDPMASKVAGTGAGVMSYHSQMETVTPTHANSPSATSGPPATMGSTNGPGLGVIRMGRPPSSSTGTAGISPINP
jgi:hypothetical protein